MLYIDLHRLFYFLAAAFGAGLAAAAFGAGAFAVVAAGLTVFFAVLAVLGLAAFAARICFLRLSNNLEVMTVGALLASLTYKFNPNIIYVVSILIYI